MLQTVIIFALLSIIPAGIVFLVMWAKNQEVLRQFDRIMHDADVLDNLEKAQKLLYGDQESIKLDIASVKESFQRLSNKIASRSRPERLERERQREDQDREPDQPQHEQQTIEFPFNTPNQQPPAAERPIKIVMRPKKWRAA
jgi:hypothetical protein